VAIWLSVLVIFMALWSTFFVIFVAFVADLLCDLRGLCG